MLDFWGVPSWKRSHGTHNGKFGKSSTQKCWLKKGDMLVSWRVLFLFKKHLWFGLLLQNQMPWRKLLRKYGFWKFVKFLCCFLVCTMFLHSLLFFGGGLGGGFMVWNTQVVFFFRHLIRAPQPITHAGSARGFVHRNAAIELALLTKQALPDFRGYGQFSCRSFSGKNRFGLCYS